mmetsp:Transcript_23207/g.52033  ORF Transcript_23207/g.52033 Transcript_23207/m.52033 type:complete len:296 (+) Transcript_23207:157-1044(+)
MIVLALLRMLTLLLTVSSSSSRVEIVSIVDALSAPLCLLKIHSLLESSSSDLSFNFLLMDPSIADSWDSAFKATFPSAQYRNRLWSRPPSLVQSSNHTFDRDLIYARFYLPDIFPELQRFIYIDNDAIVTADLGHLYSMRLTPTTPTSLPGIGDHSSGGGVPRTHNHTGNAAAMKSKMLDRLHKQGSDRGLGHRSRRRRLEQREAEKEKGRRSCSSRHGSSSNSSSNSSNNSSSRKSSRKSNSISSSDSDKSSNNSSTDGSRSRKSSSRCSNSISSRSHRSASLAVRQRQRSRPR